MRHGIDTTFLVEAEVAEHPGHEPARARLGKLLRAGDMVVLAPQVLAEFIHVVTDSRRFSKPLGMDQAIARAQLWWEGKEVVHAVPGDESIALFLRWVTEHGLGRKRLLDTMLAATYYSHGVRSILSTSARDFGVFGCFEVVTP
jgi:predicted nucleic acid-binding protein